MKKVIGLTGGIASGKSTIVDFLISKGYAVIDADKVVHELQQPGGKLNEMIRREFGSDYFDGQGRLLRKKLGQLVFSDEASRQKLGSLQNGVIREELYLRKAHEIDQLPENGVLFMDIPLLIEQDYDGFDEVWLIAVSPDEQIHRIVERDHLTVQEAKDRINAQMPFEQKKKKATHVIDSSGTIQETQEFVEKLLALL